MKLKRAVIKEELVALTGHYIAALLLNQFLYWQERTGDVDAYIAEERKRLKRKDEDVSFPLTRGWVYKSAKELNKELMLGVSDATILKYLKGLVKQRFLKQRHNPRHTWDRTLQYRADIPYIRAELKKLGYTLDGYGLLADEDAPEPPPKPPKPPKPTKVKETPHQRLMRLYQEALGYKIPHGAQEGAAAKKILNGYWLDASGERVYYTVEDAIACYRDMKKSDFWKDKHLSLMSVHKGLGEYVKGRRSKSKVPILQVDESGVY